MLGLPRSRPQLESGTMERTTRRKTTRRLVATAAACGLLGSLWAAASWSGGARRLRVLVPGRLVGGAWQDPVTLRRLITDERIGTIVTLTAINRDDPKYVG